jgi:hypothetical protein
MMLNVISSFIKRKKVYLLKDTLIALNRLVQKKKVITSYVVCNKRLIGAEIFVRYNR